jgi:hypothetical protein
MEHVFIVAIVVNGTTRDATQDALIGLLAERMLGPSTDDVIDSWWIAEDDRRDGSNCESAVFVPGDFPSALTQEDARIVLEVQIELLHDEAIDPDD